MGKRDNSECVQCTAEEDTEHLFRCPARGKWLAVLSVALRTYCNERETPEFLHKFLQHLLVSYAQGHEVETKLVFELLRGHVRRDMTDWFGPPSDARTKWTVGLIRLFWEHARLAWTQRNEAVHGDDSRSNGRERENVVRDARQLFQQAGNMSERDRSQIFPNAKLFFQRSTTTIKDWTLRSKHEVALAVHQYADDSQANTRQLDDYFDIRASAPAAQLETIARAMLGLTGGSSTSSETSSVQDEGNRDDDGHSDDESSSTEQPQMRTTQITDFFRRRAISEEYDKEHEDIFGRIAQAETEETRDEDSESVQSKTS